MKNVQDIWPLYKMNLMCRELPQNLVLLSFVKSGNGTSPEIFLAKSQNEMSDKPTHIHKTAWTVRKTTKEEDKLKMKLLKNQKEDIVDFDKEKHLIKSFILANRKQSKDIERDKKLIYSKSSGNSSVNSSNRSYKLKSQHSSGKSMVPIEVS